MVNIFIKGLRGSISIFLVLIMVAMFVLAGLTVDGARLSVAKNAASGAGDLAMNAALSEYDTLLKDMYGLFAMSGTTEELENNVLRYFSNTINNTGVLEGSDSYTRSFINSIAGLFSTEELSFDNIVDTRVESFDLVGVAGSALANPTVLERQIIDYMKYRGPVNMASGLLTKIGCIGETSKQTKALEAKINYEKKLDTVQEACEAAYEAINAFNSAIAGSGYNESDYVELISADIENSYNYNLQMTEYILAYKSTALEVDDLGEDAELKRDVEEAVKSFTGDDADKQAFEYIKGKLEVFIKLELQENGEYEPVQTEYYKFISDSIAEGFGKTIDNQLAFVANVKGAEFDEVYTYIKLYEKYFESLQEEEKLVFQKEKEVYLDIADKLNFLTQQAKNIRGGWKVKISECGSFGAKVIYDNWYKELDDIDIKLLNAIEALEKVLSKVGNLDSARENWGDKVEELTDSDIKTSMEGDYNNSARDVNETAVNLLIQVLSDNRAYFSELKEVLEQIEYYDKQICVDNSNSIDYLTCFNEIPAEQISSAESLHDIANNLMNEEYVNRGLDSIIPDKFIKITEKQQFYKYLKNICTNIDGDAGNKDEAVAQRATLINMGNDEENQTADTTGIKIGTIVGGEGISQEISDAIDALALGEETGENTFIPGIVDADGSDEAMADDNIDNLSAISALLEELSDIGETVRDKIYLEEYLTEMFSCYTSGLGADGEAVAPVALNNIDMSSNRFYRSEVEYILWGHNDVTANLNSTKAMIFGIRFALNSIYAFTSNDTRTPAMSAATAIAGWTGFGVPLVQTVILLAWAMAESVVDINNLCEGEAVCIYKSKDTWVIGINGVKNFVKEAAATAVGDIFSQIQNTAEDSIDGVSVYVEDYVANTTAGVADSVKSSIMTAVEKLALQIIGNSEGELQKSDVADKVDELLNSLEANATGEGVIEEAKRAAIIAIKNTSFKSLGGQTPQEYMIEQIYEAYLNAKSGIVTGISDSIDEMIGDISDVINGKVSEVIDACGNTLKEKVSDILASEEELVKEKIISAIDEYTMGIAGGDTYGVPSVASGLTLTYKEYLKVLVMMSLMGNETTLLKRCAKLIQANISMQEPDFDISKAATMVEVNACISVKTMFFYMPVVSKNGKDSRVAHDLDFSNIGRGRQQLKYVGILGY